MTRACARAIPRRPFERRAVRRWAAVATGFALLTPLRARAAESRVDTSYGRIDGDLAVQAGLGVTFGPRDPRPTADLRLRYMQTAGIFGTYEDGPLVGSSSLPRRVLATGIELRPLFLARWLQGWELGQPHVDLFLDSFAFEIGAAFTEPAGRGFGAVPALQAGIGLALPILPKASGPLVGLHGGCRWSEAALGGSIAGPSDRALFLNVVVAWQQLFGAHVADLGDRPPR